MGRVEYYASLGSMFKEVWLPFYVKRLDVLICISLLGLPEQDITDWWT